MTGPDLLLLGALAAASLAALLAWSRYLPRTPQVVLAVCAAAGLAVAVLEVHFTGRTRGELQEWVTLAAVALAVLGGGPACTAVFSLVDRTAPPPPPGAAPPAAPDAVGDGMRGGAWIGALERLAVVTTLVAGWPEGVVVVVGVKALGRYPELRHGERPGAAEGFIIGTLVSLLWAVACAYVITGGTVGALRIVAP